MQLPPGNQFGQYFLRADGEKYGIDGIDDTVRQQIVDLRGTDKRIQVWGTLYFGVPATEARNLVASRIVVME